MDGNFYSLYTLSSLSGENIENLRKLGIANIGDLLAYQPFRYARFVLAASDNRLRKEEIVAYLDEGVRDKELREILVSSADSLKDIGVKTAAILKLLGIETVADLAHYAPFAEAEEIVTRVVSEDSDPFAPPCVLPTCKKFTKNSKSFVSFFKQEEIRDLSVLSDNASLISSLFNFKGKETKVIHLGYSVSFLQEWIYTGVHLGEPQGSVSLFMGQDTQVSMLDWRSAISAVRREDTRVSERLTSTLFHQRAVDEVARATAEEHQHGGTSAFGANAATAGSFVAAGALVGGVGGGISGALTGLVLGNVANVAGGAPTIAGAAIGTAVGSIAGAAAGSLIFSGATTLGFVETDAEGDRGIFAKSAQNIQQRTVQNSSSIRSFWSNIISQSVQQEQQRLRTDRVTNHNRIHALNAIYFEVLNEYRVNIKATDFNPILFLPFKPIYFTEEILRRYWWFIRTLLDDKSLVLALDERFLTLSSDPSPTEELAELPDIAEIETDGIRVELNLDGSAMETIFEALVGAALVGAAVAAFRALFDAGKRENIKVAIITSEGTRNLTRVNSPNADPNFVGRYTTSERVPVHTIEKIKITNSNGEFSILGFDLNSLAFEGVTSKISIRNKSNFTPALPNIGALEDEQTVLADTFTINANSSKQISWNIADRLRDQFEGINAQREELEAELASDELTAAKLENLLGFLNANKFGFTRLILQNTEREQVISVLEEVEIGGVDLTSIASSTPLGYCGNHVALLLKNCPHTDTKFDPIGIDTTKLELILTQFESVNPKKPQDMLDYLNALRDFLGEFLKSASTGGNGSAREKELLNRVEDLLKTLRKGAGNPATLPLLLTKIAAAIKSLLLFLNAQVQTNNTDVTRLCEYYESVKQSLKDKVGVIVSSDEVSLPSPAVFMEPVLSNAKGAELYDMRRNSHYEILSAPAISAVDPNVLRSQNIQLTPNVPAPSLTIQNAPEFPLPTSITAALAEAGKLDLSALINTNAGTLNTTLSNLSTVATELAKASAQLTGDAQKQALASAGEVAKQIGDIIGKSLQTPTTAPPAPKPAPPEGQQSKAEVTRELDRINKGGGTDKEKKEKKETIGAPVAPDDTRDYQMSILFLDENGIPYPEGDFTLGMSFFEFGSTVEINNGASIPMANGEFFFPDVFTLKKGRLATIRISATIASAFIPGIKEFTLPDKPDIIFKCRMKSETRKITGTSVKNVTDEALQNSSFGVAINPLFNSFLNAGVEFPFRIFKISADGGSKIELNLRGEYNSSTGSTTTTTTGDTTVTEFEVVMPKNGWDIEVI